MPKIIALLLLLIGAGLVWHGFQVRDSLKGRAQAVSSDVQKSVTGDTKVTDATLFMVGGGVLAVVGAGLALKR
jgi:hypothetical protein